MTLRFSDLFLNYFVTKKCLQTYSVLILFLSLDNFKIKGRQTFILVILKEKLC